MVLSIVSCSSQLSVSRSQNQNEINHGELIPGEDSAGSTRVEALRAENEKSSSSGVRFSRLCRGCLDSNPSERVVLTHCGHAVCRTCADAVARHSTMQCPICEKLSFFVRLFEERTTGEENTADARDASFSRVCGVCYASNPAVRAAVKSCGHVACFACIEKMKKSGERVKCPFCRENAPIIRLVEYLLSPDDGTEQGVWEMPELPPSDPDAENPTTDEHSDSSYSETATSTVTDSQAEEDAAVPHVAEPVNPYQLSQAEEDALRADPNQRRVGCFERRPMTDEQRANNPYAHLDNEYGDTVRHASWAEENERWTDGERPWLGSIFGCLTGFRGFCG